MEKILLKNIDKPDSQEIETYISGGGYKALGKALDMKPEDVIEEVKKSKLIGRGGAGFPTGLKWEFLRKEKGQPKYVICNADEGEPGTFKDKVILGKDPHLLLESIAICGCATGAEKGFIYIRGEYFGEIDILNKAVEQARAKGFLGENILGSGLSFDIQVFKGAGAYVCGEETSLFESMEGDRACPREKPPFPTQSGVYEKPTVINNVETLCNVPAIILNGGDWYSKIGSPDSPGPKLFCLSGHIERPGVYELPMGISLRDLVTTYGGGVKGKFKAVLPGGVSSSFLDTLDVDMDYNSVMNAGSMLGSAAVIVMNSDTDMVDACKNIMEFFAHESCGHCAPCREGTRRTKEILTQFVNGEGKLKYLDLLTELKDVMYDTCRCGLGQAALNGVVSGIEKFKGEFVTKISE